MGEELTPANFVQKIKSMTAADRRGITAKKLIELILASPNPDERERNIDTQLEQLQASMKLISTIATTNKEEMTQLRNENTAMSEEIRELKENAGNNNNNENLEKKIEDLRSKVEEIDQYLRVNNLEFVGLPAPNETAGETEESIIVNACNSLAGISVVVRPEDIDISHSLHSNRRDNKPVHIAKFVSRKTKFAILTAKRSDLNKQFKFRNQDLYINEHLSKTNRGLFAAANEKKRLLGYKHLWTKAGVVNMRKTDQSDVIVIKKESDFLNLV